MDSIDTYTGKIAPDYLMEDAINEQTGIFPEFPGIETPPIYVQSGGNPYYQEPMPKIFAPEPSQPPIKEQPANDQPEVITESGQTTVVMPEGKAPNNKTLLLIGGAVLLYFLFSKK